MILWRFLALLPLLLCEGTAVGSGRRWKPGALIDCMIDTGFGLPRPSASIKTSDKKIVVAYTLEGGGVFSIVSRKTTKIAGIVVVSREGGPLNVAAPAFAVAAMCLTGGDQAEVLSALTKADEPVKIGDAFILRKRQGHTITMVIADSTAAIGAG